ncbi:MAG: serine hydrolase [Gemmataceae bacterium]|nr:class A beta-lactamase-related serine hydrolase [Gemmata sp.]MDW8197811.1 serine hydrolase [Gemmataceae bacterium]
MRVWFVVAVVCLGLPAGAGASDLETRIAPLVKDHKGRVAVAIKHLKTGETYFHNADERLPTASLIKLPIMVEAYWQAREKTVDFEKKLTLTKDDKVPGSGILTAHFSEGTTFPLKDAIRLMIVFSDNTATNMVLDQIGLAATNRRMDKLGFKNTKVNAKVFKGSTTSLDPEATQRYGLGSTTAREMIGLLELIETGQVVSPEACQDMLRHLKACDDRDKLPRLLPPGTVVAHKTGAVNAARTDAGIIYLPSGPVAVCVLTNDNADKSWSRANAAEVLIATIGKEVYDHFTPVKK